MTKAMLVCCSDARKYDERKMIDELKTKLHSFGIDIDCAEHIFSQSGMIRSASPEVRADELMNCFISSDTENIFDISGGDIANELLDHLDYEMISQSYSVFWGYSDLTTIINAIYTKTGKSSVLYQIKNIIGTCGQLQTARVKNFISAKDNELFDIKGRFISGGSMKGITVGGNIRCLLKLAGTEYFPDMNGKVLVLEARGGKAGQIISFFNQLKQMRVYDKINGMILGTFTTLDNTCGTGFVERLALEVTGGKLPIFRTYEFGHSPDSKAVIIGEELAVTQTCSYTKYPIYPMI